MRRNYTLIEMVIAVGIFGMVMLCASMGLSVIHKTWSSIALQNQRMRNCQVIDAVIDSAFRNAIPFTWNDDNKKNRVVFLGESGKVVLAYQHRINNAADGGIRFISLFLDNGNLVASYSRLPMLPWGGNRAGPETCSEVLAEKVRHVSFIYAGRKKDSVVWNQSWNPEDNSNNIPLAIQIRIEWDNGDSEVWMRRTAGAGLRESYGIRTEKE